MRTRSRGIALPAAMAMVGLMWGGPAHAGYTFKIDETKSISIGIGARGSFAAVEDASPSGEEWSKDFTLDNSRIYLSGQVHDWIKLELNTECIFCSNADLREFVVLDAIAKFEISPWFNIWAGRLLVPSDRAEMDGPFYGNVYENFKTPFYSSDFSVSFGDGGAGVYGRDHGVNVWGAVLDGRFQYVFGIFNGLRGAQTGDDELLFATRLAFNFLEVEKNPAYYTSSTYFGGGGDILTLAYALQYQENGAGSALHKGDMTGMSVDLLFEKPLEGVGTFTLEGEYKYFDADYSTEAFADEGCFCMFDGDAVTFTALYLFPEKTGPGAFQPYVRYTDISPDSSSDRDEFEVGLNYVISGHSSRISLFYQHGDLATKSIVNFAPDVGGDDVSAIKLGVQLQI